MEIVQPPFLSRISPNRIRLARMIAVAADALQLILFPLFSAGFISPVDDALDVLVFCALTYLLGWHISFLPGLLFESLPIIDLAPTWTIAVFIATRSKAHPPFKRAVTTVYAETQDSTRAPKQIANG